MNWTDSQRDAIFANKGSILVSAAAGSGKTAVLVQRVIETITAKENPIPIDRMLIVTFTRAAREEMLTRVEKALNKLLKEDPYNKHLLMQRQLLYNAKITTIDGFCTDFVRQYFYRLDIQQDFRIADEKELSILKNQALDNTIEYFYNEDLPEFKSLVDSMCTYRNDSRLRDNILKLYNFLTSIPFKNIWMDEKLKYYDLSFTPTSENPYVKYILDYAKQCVSYCVQLNENASFLLKNNDVYLDEKNIIKLKDLLEQDKAELLYLNKLTEDSDWNGINKVPQTLKWATYPRFKDDTGIKESIKNIRDNYKAEIKSILEYFKSTLEDIEEDTITLYPLIKTFFDCVKRFDYEFTNLKKDKNVLDFADIENNMINLLCHYTEKGIEYTDTAKEISSMFDCIMVDEFQDINEVQNLIFKAISKNENNLFMVGDVKQSIYGFRQANPEIFTSYKEKYNLYDKNNEKYPAKIILDKNFRSRESVLNACNFVFDKLMSPQVGGITYNEEEILNCGNTSYTPYEQAKTEVMLFNTFSDDEENEETKVEAEARNVAKRIIKLIYEDKYQVQGKDGLRPVQLGDIAILLRSSKGMGQKASVYTDVLTELGIPAVASEKKSIFDTIEIKILLNILRVTDNPMLDIPLLSMLMSPVCGFTPDDLAQIRTDFPKDPLYTAIVKSESKNEKCRSFLKMLSVFRTASVTTSVDKLIGLILEYTGFESVVMALNSDVAKNIYLLQKYARDYSESGYISLTSFISLIDNMIDKGISLDGSVSGEGEVLNAVRVMSIHASKGLEFPVCFICDTNTKFNIKDTANDLVISADAGVGIRYKNDFIKYDCVHRKAISLMLKNSFISEEIRILYVAMTRAKEKLIITAGSKEPEKYVASVSSKLTSENISPYVVANFNRLSDWITACVLTHPSGKMWRYNADSTLEIKDNPDLLPWDIFNYDDIYFGNDSEVEKSETSKEEKVPENSEFAKIIRERINFKYKYDYLTTLPQKVSASELSHKDNKIFDKVLQKPTFMEDNKKSGVNVGTAFHKFIERCNFSLAKADVKTEAERLKNAGFLTENQFEMLDIAKISDFINSKFFKRIINADDVHREYKFTVKINNSDYDSDIPKELASNQIIMQGAVDLVFEENQQLVIVDYKTDKVKDINSLGEIYSKQLLLYKSAIEQSFEKEVKELYIYSLYLGQNLKIEF